MKVTGDSEWNIPAFRLGGCSVQQETARYRARALGGLVIAATVLWAIDSQTPVKTLAQTIAPLPEVNGWSTAADLLVPRSEHSIALLDGRIYAMGGYPYGRIPSDVVQVYTVASDRWALGPPLPVPLHHTVAESAGGRLYVIGGEFEGAGTGRPSQSVDTVYELDPRAGAWSRRSAMPTARSGGAWAVTDGKVYKVGGRLPRGNDFAAYDPAADRWTVLPNLPTQRNHLAAPRPDRRALCERADPYARWGHHPGRALGSVIHWTYRPGIACG